MSSLYRDIVVSAEVSEADLTSMLDRRSPVRAQVLMRTMLDINILCSALISLCGAPDSLPAICNSDN